MSDATTRVHPPFSEVVNRFASLSEADISVLQTFVAMNRGLDTSPENIDSLARSLKLTNYDANYIIYAVKATLVSLESESEQPLSLDSFCEKIRLFARRVDKEPEEINRDALANLFLITQGNEALRVETKIAAIKHGVLDEAAEFTAHVDIRPIFDATNSTVLNLVAVAQMQIFVRTYDQQTPPINLQIDIAALNSLKACIDDLEKQITAIKNQFGSDIFG